MIMRGMEMMHVKREMILKYLMNPCIHRFSQDFFTFDGSRLKRIKTRIHGGACNIVKAKG